MILEHWSAKTDHPHVSLMNHYVKVVDTYHSDYPRQRGVFIYLEIHNICSILGFSGAKALRYNDNGRYSSKCNVSFIYTDTVLQLVALNCLSVSSF